MQTSKPLIALLDTEPEARKEHCRILTARGCAVEEFNHSVQLLTAMGQSLFDCLVVDLQLPEIDGEDLLKLLGPPPLSIPVVILTSAAGVGVSHKVLALGASAYLLKPVQAEDLYAAVDVALSQSGHRLPERT